MTWTNNYNPNNPFQQPQYSQQPQQPYGQASYGQQQAPTPQVDVPDLTQLINGQGGKAFFNADSKPGATITGTVEAVKAKQSIDFQTKQPAFSKSGKPKFEIVVTLATSLREDPDDDGRRNIYIKCWGTQADALRDACRKAGVPAPQEGDKFTATFTGMGQPFAPGMSAPKLYEYRIEKGADPQVMQAMNSTAPQQAQQQSEQFGQAQPPHVDAMQVTGLRNMGKSDQEIANLLGVPLAAVTRIAGQARVQGSEMSGEPEF